MSENAGFPKVLIVSQAAWDDSTNFGSTFSNFFSNWDRKRIAHIYTEPSVPNTQCCETFFNISEKTVFSSTFRKGTPTGLAVQSMTHMDLDTHVYDNSERKAVEFVKTHVNIQIISWVRELLWGLGKWKSAELDRFLQEFEPDIVFLTFGTTFFINRIQRYIINQCKKPAVVMYTSDDGYTLKQFSLSPLYWIDRLAKRRTVRGTLDLVHTLYVISSEQLEEYNAIFDQKCKLLYKSADFSGQKGYKRSDDGIIKMVYTGNINLNRWKSLARIGQVIERANGDERRAELVIYSHTRYTKRIKNRFEKIPSINFRGGVSHNEVSGIQEDADILVHCEALGLKNYLRVRLSFSTKIVDYLSHHRCIFAVGRKECASIRYFLKNDAAVVATSECEIGEKLIVLLNDKTMIEEYARKAWECGKRNHQMGVIQRSLYKDLRTLAQEVGKRVVNSTNP